MRNVMRRCSKLFALMFSLVFCFGALFTSCLDEPETDYKVTAIVDGGDPQYKMYLDGRTCNRDTFAKEKTGYTISWKIDDQEIEGSSFTVTQDVTVIITYVPITYFVRFDLAETEGIAPERMECKYDVSYTIPEDSYEVNGYNFVGWATKENAKDNEEGVNYYPKGTSFANLSCIQDDEIVLYPYFTKQDLCSVTVVSDHSELSESERQFMVAKGSVITKNSLPVLDDDLYTFDKWTYEMGAKTGTVYSTSGITVNEDIVITAVWKDPCTVKISSSIGSLPEGTVTEFKVKTGTVLVSEKFSLTGYNYTIVKLPSPVLSDDDMHVFLGWKSLDGKNEIKLDASSKYVVNQDMEFAAFFADPVKVTFSTEHGEFPAEFLEKLNEDNSLFFKAGTVLYFNLPAEGSAPNGDFYVPLPVNCNLYTPEKYNCIVEKYAATYTIPLDKTELEIKAIFYAPVKLRFKMESNFSAEEIREGYSEELYAKLIEEVSKVTLEKFGTEPVLEKWNGTDVYAVQVPYKARMFTPFNTYTPSENRETDFCLPYVDDDLFFHSNYFFAIDGINSTGLKAKNYVEIMDNSNVIKINVEKPESVRFANVESFPEDAKAQFDAWFSEQNFTRDPLSQDSIFLRRNTKLVYGIEGEELEPHTLLLPDLKSETSVLRRWGNRITINVEEEITPYSDPVTLLSNSSIVAEWNEPVYITLKSNYGMESVTEKVMLPKVVSSVGNSKYTEIFWHGATRNDVKNNLDKYIYKLPVLTDPNGVKTFKYWRYKVVVSTVTKWYNLDGETKLGMSVSLKDSDTNFTLEAVWE